MPVGVGIFPSITMKGFSFLAPSYEKEASAVRDEKWHEKALSGAGWEALKNERKADLAFSKLCLPTVT